MVDARCAQRGQREQGGARDCRGHSVDTEIFPLVNNYDPEARFMPESAIFCRMPRHARSFLDQVDAFLRRTRSYRGLSLDFEEIPAEAQPGYRA